MKNKDLIAILSQQDPEMEVFLEYDTLCCVYRDFSIVKVIDSTPYEQESWRNETGIWLMCEDERMVHYLWGETRMEVDYEVLYGGLK